MNFNELQAMTLSDRFGESSRGSAKEYLNSRYGRVFLHKPWTFRLVTRDVPLSYGANSTPLGDFSRVIAVWDTTTSGNYPTELRGAIPEDFFDNYNDVLTNPEDFTVVNDEIVFNRQFPQISTLKVYGELDFVPMVNDADVPNLPSPFHTMLVDGASSDLLKMENDPSYGPFEQSFQAALIEMERTYLANMPRYSAFPSWS